MAQRRALKDTVNDPMVKKEGRVDSTPKRTSAEQREIAKAEMVSSLATLFLTGFFKFKGAKMLHGWAGWALLGFSLWHHMLSISKSKAISDR
jgi:thiosulfate reductase cytochrome b subunit